MCHTLQVFLMEIARFKPNRPIKRTENDKARQLTLTKEKHCEETKGARRI